MTQRPPLEEMTLRQLRRVASEVGVSRYSRMRKDQLLLAIRELQVARQQGMPAIDTTVQAQEAVEAAKFDVGQDRRAGVALAAVDEGLPDLPGGYGDSRVVLMPRDPQWAYAYWDVPDQHKQSLRRQGGQQLALRIYDVTDVDLNYQSPHSIQEYPCDELAREWYLPIPVSDRDYVIDIGYRCADGRWLILARSSRVRIPPVYPSDWIEDYFLTIGWDEDLQGKTFMELMPSGRRMSSDFLANQLYGMAASAEAQRLAGSLYGSMQAAPGSMQQVPGSMQQVPGSMMHVAGSMQQVPGSMMHVAGSMMHVAGSIQQVPGSMQQVPGSMMHVAGSMQQVPGSAQQVMSSYVLASGVGMWASGAALTMSGVGMSGVGFSASMPPIRPRKFWLVADAELIVYGATEPDASVTVGGQPVQLGSDGTFRFQMSFQDGTLDFPILAVAADGEQNRSIHMRFTRETPERRGNTREEAVEEWLA